MTNAQGALAIDISQESTFNFGSHAVRVVMCGGEPWFVCTDVAHALGYRNAPDAARNLAMHQKGTHNLRTLGGDQTVTIINESGLYRLVLRSRKPEAVAFSDWVTGEVLPSIRKTGSYSKTADAPKQRQRFKLTLCHGEAFIEPLTDDALVTTREKFISTLADPQSFNSDFERAITKALITRFDRQRSRS